MKIRETGYYWIKFRSEHWEPASYFDYTKKWTVLGYSLVFKDSDIDEIDEKMIKNEN
jgi:hypothetical protein